MPSSGTSTVYTNTNYSNSRPPQNKAEDAQSALNQVRMRLSELKISVNNHESEIRTFENKLNNQELAFEHLRENLVDQLQNNQSFVKASRLMAEDQFQAQEKINKHQENILNGIVGDLRQLSAQAQETSQVLTQYKQKITDIENLMNTERLHLQHIEETLQTMMELIQIKNDAKKSSSVVSAQCRTYKVQSGDVLEKIARLHQVPVQLIRDSNPQIVNDRIFVGQTLTIPGTP